MGNSISRRIFAVLGLGAILCLAAAASTAHLSAAEKGRVLIVEHPGATDAFDPQRGPIREMVREGLLRFTGQKSVKDAWFSLISPKDIVGIKVHSAPGAYSGTRPAVAAEVVESLLQAGLPPGQIIVWDRRFRDLVAAGFFQFEERYGIRVRASIESGFDPEISYEMPLIGKLVFGDLEFGATGEQVGRKSYVSKLLTQRITKIVNLTPLLNHNQTGVSGVLWGLALGSVDNILRFDFDPERMAQAIPEIYAMPQLSDRVVLNIVDALICQYQGEERTRLHFSAQLNQLWFSKDPVALDVLAIEELQRQRRAAKSPEVKVNQLIYKNAALLQLGEANPRQITVERLLLDGAEPARLQ